jgi:hypothetical protein
MYRFRTLKQNKYPADGTRHLPRDAHNALTKKEIGAGVSMVNFHGEAGRKHFFTYSTFKRLPAKQFGLKVNPFTGKQIKPRNVTRYRARGGSKN